jgi:hypothetical protein
MYKQARRTQRENKDMLTRINAVEKIQTTGADAD